MAKTIYTMGMWSVKPGRERSFVKLWTDFARWNSKNQSWAKWGLLLKDTEKTGTFFTIGPWKDKKMIRQWRNTPEFKEFIAKARTLCRNKVQPNILQEIIKVQ
jgi:hypothetical protein